MAIVDIEQSTPSHGPPKMIQIAPVSVHQPSPNSSEHTAMGTSSGKAQKMTPIRVAKRHQPYLVEDTLVQSKKPNLHDNSDNNTTDVFKQYGINSDEITLTRVNMSPKTQNGASDKSFRKSTTKDVKEYDEVKRIPPSIAIKTCNGDIPSECREIISSDEVSIVKLQMKKDTTPKEKKRIENDNNARIDFQTDNQQDTPISDFWNKPSMGKSRMFVASEFLYGGENPNVSKNYSNPNMMINQNLLPDDENQDGELDSPKYSNQDACNQDIWYTNPIIIQDHSNYSPDSAYGSMGDSEMSHFMLGFPNPPGENRCWLNATLHTLFATLFSLPIANDMYQLLQSDKCSKISLMLGDLHELWRKGGSEKNRIYNTIKKFKDNLSTLERTYCSDRQQDVSEFLMALLNHLKADFYKLLSKETTNQEKENISENLQLGLKPKHSSIRSPLSKHRLRSSTSSGIFSDTASSTVVDSTDSNSFVKSSNDLSDSEDSIESKKKIIENPIDKYFLQKMVEDYVCKECSKHRQMPIENLMVYADIPAENDVSSVDLTEAFEKIFSVEERSLVCEHCKHNTHNMKTYYKEYPKVLIIQINRWRMSNDGLMNKICTAVSIPEKLSLNNFLIEEGDFSKTYEPISIISHVGNNMDCGHYTSYIKHEDQWFHYNDMNVMPMTSKEALTAAQSTAYLLFYVDSDLDKPTLDCYSSRCSPIH